MEKFINQTKGFLGVLQSTMSEKELDRSEIAALEIHKTIKAIIDNHELNYKEALNSILAVNADILQTAVNIIKKENSNE